jgi:hypothetical protein
VQEVVDHFRRHWNDIINVPSPISLSLLIQSSGAGDALLLSDRLMLDATEVTAPPLVTPEQHWPLERFREDAQVSSHAGKGNSQLGHADMRARVSVVGVQVSGRVGSLNRARSLQASAALCVVELERCPWTGPSLTLSYGSQDPSPVSYRSAQPVLSTLPPW